jgi:hypothetical protein
MEKEGQREGAFEVELEGGFEGGFQLSAFRAPARTKAPGLRAGADAREACRITSELGS